eukprot:15356877-Ditylum_brightwellii.AAC.1
MDVIHWSREDTSSSKVSGVVTTTTTTTPEMGIDITQALLVLIFMGYGTYTSKVGHAARSYLDIYINQQQILKEKGKTTLQEICILGLEVDNEQMDMVGYDGNIQMVADNLDMEFIDEAAMNNKDNDNNMED